MNNMGHRQCTLCMWKSKGISLSWTQWMLGKDFA
jgi:hypothetical protein